MTNFMVFDCETSISRGPHGPSFKDFTNDFHTVIAGDSLNNIQVEHRRKGFNRELPGFAIEMLENATMVIGHNLPFDLAYIWKTKAWQDYLLKGGQVWDCFPPEVEILTDLGWSRFDQLDNRSPVAQYTVDGTIEFVKPIAHICNDYDGELVLLEKNLYMSHLSTPNHNRVIRTYRHNKLKLVRAKSKASKYSHNKSIVAGLHDGSGVCFSDDELMLMIAAQADGHINKKGYLTFDLVKQRKRERLEALFVRLGVDYKKYGPYEGRNSISYRTKDLNYLLHNIKLLGMINPITLSLNQKRFIINELQYWDGMKGSKNSLEYYSYDPEMLGKIQLIACLAGYRTHLTENRLSITLNKSEACQNFTKIENVPYKGKVYCVTVPSGMIVTRYKGKVQITGNCQIAEYLMSGQRHAFSSLSELQFLYLGAKVKKDRISKLFAKKHGADEIISRKNDCPRLFSLFHQYCIDDGETTLRVAIAQLARAKSLGMMPIIKAYNRYMLGLVETMTTGIHVDRINAEKTLRAFKLKSLEYLKKSENITKKYWDNEHLPEFNVQSPTHKSALLFGGEIKCKTREEVGLYKNGNIKTKIVERMIEVKGFGLPTELTTESGVKGKYKTGSDIIDKIAKYTDNPVIQEYCILQRKAMNIEKMCNTYLEPFLNLSVQGILYPHYNNTATATGRLSSSKPNLQNIPSKGGMEKYIKNQLVAPPGYICCSIDYSQLEIYILAMMSGDVSLTNDLLEGVDFHVKRLSYAEDKCYEEVYDLCKVRKLPEWEAKRTAAKTISYQKAYGASPKSLSRTTGIEESIIKKIFEQEDLEYPGVKEFNATVTREASATKELSFSKNIPKFRKGHTKDSKKFLGGVELLPVRRDKLNCDYFNEEFRYIGYYRSITGKRYAFEEMANYDFNGRIRRGFSQQQIMNYSQQGGAADVVALATYAVFRYVMSHRAAVQMVNQVHDSLEFYIKEDEQHLHIPELQRIMNDVPALFKEFLNVEVPFKFRTDAKVGKNFADTVEYKPLKERVI